MNTQEITAEFIAAYVDYLLADGRDGATLDEAAHRLAKARAAADRVLDPLIARPGGTSRARTGSASSTFRRLRRAS
jgi:hypothetical protein